MPPKTIAGRYVVERAVGRGGMGTVWLCRDEILGRDVAVKEVGSMPGESTSDLARALREARSSAALSHRNVVSVYDAVEDGDRNWLVMEYVPSRTLAEILREDGPMSPERAAWLGAQAADGLAAAHARQTMHRDVKPGNILVTEDDHVKITDFGIARTHGDDQLTRAGLVTGTPAYFAPELARGEEPTLAADVWALGATLYAAVEGRAPYPDQPNAIALLTKIASGPPLPPTRAAFLREPIERMMERDPGARWTMSEAARALHRLRDQPRGAPAQEQTVALAGAATVPEKPPARLAPTPHEDRDDDRRRGGGGWLVALAAVVLLVLLAAVGAYLLNQRDDVTPTATDPPSAEETTAAEPSPDPTTADPTPADPTTADPAPADPTEDPSDEATEEEPETELTEEAEPTTDAPTPTTDPAATGASRGAFAENYYGALPGDTETSWTRLSPANQERVGGYGRYEGFWNTVSSVTVSETRPAGPDAVDVVISYVNNDGSSATETRRLFLERSGGSYLIASDQIVG